MRLTTRITTPAALLLGAGLGLFTLSDDSAIRSGASLLKESSAAYSSHLPSLDPGSFAVTATTHPTESAGAYAAAWNSLKDGQLPRQERIAIQCAIVREWAMADLSAATRAVTADQDYASMFWSHGAKNPLRSALLPGIEAQPDLTLHFIETHAFGLHTKWLREAWIKAVGSKNPKKAVAASYCLLSHEQDEVMRMAVERTTPPESAGGELDEIVATVLALPASLDGDSPRRALVRQLLSTLSKQDLGKRISHTQNSVIRDVYAEAYRDSIEPLELAPLEAE